jgi:hypothetical protein
LQRTPTSKTIDVVASEKPINIAITGTLSKPRAMVAELIDATENGHFVEWVTYETHYLVCAKADSLKAKKAARLGTAVIHEDELNEYLMLGRFPSTKLPERPERHNNFPEIEWTDKASPEFYLLTYRDARENTTIRKVWITSIGYSVEDPTTRWMGGYDSPQFKTWRADRIIELEVLPVS